MSEAFCNYSTSTTTLYYIISCPPVQTVAARHMKPKRRAPPFWQRSICYYVWVYPRTTQCDKGSAVCAELRYFISYIKIPLWTCSKLGKWHLYKWLSNAFKTNSLERACSVHSNLTDQWQITPARQKKKRTYMNLYKYYISAYVCCGPPECSRGSMENLSNVLWRKKCR